MTPLTILDMLVFSLIVAVTIVLWCYAAAIGIIHIRRSLDLPTRDLPRLPHFGRGRSQHAKVSR